MKKTIWALALTLAFLSPRAFAQTITPCTPQSNTTPNQVTRQVQRLTQELGLSSAQATAATCYFTNADVCESSLAAALKADRQNLQTAIDGAVDNSGISTALTALQTDEIKLATCSATAENLFWNSLSSSQQTTVQSHHGFGPGMGPRGGFGPGPGGPGGPPAGPNGFRGRN